MAASRPLKTAVEASAEPAPIDWQAFAPRVPPPEELEDNLVYQGFFRYEQGAQTTLDAFRNHLARAREAEESAFALERADLEGRAARAREEAEEAEAVQAALAAQRRELSDRLLKVEERAAVLESQRAILFDDLVTRRAGYRSRLLSDHLDEFRSQARRITAEILADEQKEREFQQNRHEEEKRRFAAELEHRRREIEAKRKEARARSSELEERIAALRRLGVTRTTAGFLVWAGYLGLSAFGWYFGLLMQRLQGDLTWIKDVLSLLLTATAGVLERAGPWGGAAFLLLLPFLLWSLIIAVLWSADRLMGAFDGGWVRRRRGGGGRGDGRGGGGRLTGWRYSPLRRVRREDYLDWMARTPLLVLSAEIPLALLVFLSWGGSDGMLDLEGMPEPWRSFYFTFIGVTLMITLTGVAFLYCSRVIEPRHEALLRSGAPISPVRANRELVALFGLAAVLLIGLEALRWGFPALPSVWSADNLVGAVIIGLLNAFLLAYGLSFRGQFKDRRALDKELEGYEETLSKLDGIPENLFEEAESERLSEALESLQAQMNASWEEKIARASVSARGGWPLRRRRPPGDDGSEVRSHPLFVYGDSLLEPELTEAFKAVKLEIGEVDAQRGTLRRRLEEIQKEVAAAPSPQSLREQETTLRRELVDKQRQQATRLTVLETSFTSRSFAAETAYLVGVAVRDEVDKAS